MRKTGYFKRSVSAIAVAALAAATVGCTNNRANRELAALQDSLEAGELSDRQKAEEFIPRFEVFAEQYWGTEAALTAKLWLLEQTPWQRGDGTMNESAGRIADDILEEYPRSPQLVRLAESSDVFSNMQKEKYFGHLSEDSPHKSVRAAAVYVLAEMGERTDDVDLKEKREEHLQVLIDEYGDVELRKNVSYGAIADALLYPHDTADLEIGKPAPEIIGNTVDGKEMRLSDFRGKVVVIDFWGDW